MAAGLGALGDHDVDPGSLVREGLLRGAAERGDEAARRVDLADHVRRRRAERVRDQPHPLVLHRHLDLRRGGGRGPAEQLVHRALAFGEPRHAVLGQDPVSELAVRLGDRGAQLRLELLGVELAHALVAARDHDVDAVGLAAHVLVDPLELDLELLRREAHRAEHAEAAGLAHGRDHVAAVAEGEDRELDPERLAYARTHLSPPRLQGRVLV